MGDVNATTPRSPTTSAPRARIVQPASDALYASAFTALELCVSLSILVIVAVAIVPLVRTSAFRSNDFRCETSLRRAVFDFTVFADARGGWGFTLGTFVQSLYGVGEFWNTETDMVERVGSRDVFGCSSSPGVVVLDGRERCLSKQVGPAQSVSYGFNARLVRAERRGGVGREASAPVVLDSSVTRLGRTPLVWDVNGAEAGRRGLIARFSAPADDEEGYYGDGRRWFPARRHRGTMNAGFLDGSVGSSADPLGEMAWGWSRQTIE